MTLEMLTNAGLWTFFFVTFEIVLIIGETTNYYFSAAIFIELLKC